MKNNRMEITLERNLKENYNARLQSYSNKLRSIHNGKLVVNERDYKRRCSVLSKNIVNTNKNYWEELRIQFQSQKATEEECHIKCEEAAATEVIVIKNEPETIVTQMIIAEYLMMYLEEKDV